MTAIQWDYVFLLSNEPVPGLVEKVQCAVAAGRRVVVAYMSRSWTPLEVDSLAGATVFRVPVGHRAVDVRRFTQFFTTMWRLRRDVFAYAAPNCDVYTDAIDLLTMAELLGIGKDRLYRFEVRDLHPLQLRRGVLPTLVRLLEVVLLRRVGVLVLTSRMHYDTYYRHRFSRSPTFVENVPARGPWIGFTRIHTDKFIVGFIGVVRYRQCLETLIAAVKALNQGGLPIYLRIAGGGILEGLAAQTVNAPYIELLGPFKYADAAQRLFGDLSIINSVYDAGIENVRLAISNKFYEAQITGIPLMVAEGTLLADLVLKSGIGTAVRHADVQDVAAKIAEAYRGGGWHDSARTRLASINVGDMFSRHELEVAAAVLEEPVTGRQRFAALDGSPAAS